MFMKIGFTILLLGVSALCGSGSAQPIVGEIHPLVFDNHEDIGSLRSTHILSDGEGHVVVFWNGELWALSDFSTIFARESFDYGITWSELPMVEREVQALLDFQGFQFLHSEFLPDDKIRLFAGVELNQLFVFPWLEINTITYDSGNTPLVTREDFERGLYVNHPSQSQRMITVEPDMYRLFFSIYDGPAAWQTTTSDGGATWTALEDSPIVAESVSGFGDIQYANHPDGSIGALWENHDSSGNFNGGLHFARSTDQGATWVYTDGVGGASLPGRNRPQLAFSNGTWLGVFHHYPYAPGTNTVHNIYTVRSTDNGATWTAPTPVHINNLPVDEALDSNMKLLALNNTFVVAWLSNNNLPESTDTPINLLYTYSENHGATWASATLLADNADNSFTFNYEDPFDIDYLGNDQFFISWRGEQENINLDPLTGVYYTTLTFPDLFPEPVPMPLIGAEGKPVQTLIHLGAILLLFCGLFVVSIRTMKSSAS